MSINPNAQFAQSSSPFSPTFFALAGFVNEATAAPAGPVPVVATRPASRLWTGVKALIRRVPKVADTRTEDEKLLPPTVQAIAGFVEVATGHLPRT